MWRSCGGAARLPRPRRPHLCGQQHGAERAHAHQSEGRGRAVGDSIAWTPRAAIRWPKLLRLTQGLGIQRVDLKAS